MSDFEAPDWLRAKVESLLDEELLEQQEEANLP
jgi:hypothetical protein